MSVKNSETVERTIAFSKRFAKSPSKALSTFYDNRRNGLLEAKLVQEVETQSDEPLNLEHTLNTLARHENLGKTASYKFGYFINEILLDDSSMGTLCEAAQKVRKTYPDSILLIFLHTVSLANQGDIVPAHDIISEQMLTLQDPEMKERLGAAEVRRRLIALGKIWRILDGEARNNMHWVNGESSEENRYDKLSFMRDIDTSEDFNASLELAFLEPYLQGKFSSQYLDGCQIIFNRSKTLTDKLKTLIAIIRPGARRLNAYHDSFELAGRLYETLTPQWSALLLKNGQLTTEALAAPKKTVSILRHVLKLTQKLERTKDINLIANTLSTLGMSKKGQGAKWLIARTLIEIDAELYLDISKNIMSQGPIHPTDLGNIEHYMAWSMHAQEYNTAIAFFEKQPGKYRRHRSGLVYVNLLQRVGRFKDAANIARGVNAAALVRPASLCPYSVWANRRRIGELDFTAETADYFSMVAQPQTPKGVVFVTCRTIEQMRRTPIVILMEWKRMGWAVIPIVEGLLPLEPTGVPEIDQYLGCLTLHRHFKLGVSDKFIDPVDFKSDLKRGKLTWDNIDLSHALWEEAAVNRRVYDVDYSCPLLQQYLGNNVRWTQLCAKLLKNIRKTMTDLELRTGMLIAYNHRLPDAIFRFYCETYGNPDTFFCLHSANGYQNYFANFSTNVSTKGVIRNMTKYPETRSGSFPVPAKFESYYKANKEHAPLILDMVKDVTKVKRSTEGVKDIPDDLKAAKKRILDWKAKGGKVACAFGKVVCDSSVPFDGGPAHASMKDWINHTIASVAGSDTLLLIKPHPHELKEEIACFMNEYFVDIIDQDLPDNVMFLGHRWFDIAALKEFVDLGLIYNGTTSIELAILNIPSVLCSHFAPIDYPVGHAVPKNREDYARYVRFEQKVKIKKDLPYRAACWLHYMSGTSLTKDYRFHARQITNKVLYPSWWFKEDIWNYLNTGDANVSALADEALQ